MLLLLPPLPYSMSYLPSCFFYTFLFVIDSTISTGCSENSQQARKYAIWEEMLFPFFITRLGWQPERADINFFMRSKVIVHKLRLVHKLSPLSPQTSDFDLLKVIFYATDMSWTVAYIMTWQLSCPCLTYCIWWRTRRFLHSSGCGTVYVSPEKKKKNKYKPPHVCIYFPLNLEDSYQLKKNIERKPIEILTILGRKHWTQLGVFWTYHWGKILNQAMLWSECACTVFF